MGRVTLETPLLVDLLAAHRLTRLVTADVITQRPRDFLVGWSYRRRGRPEDHVEDPPVSGWADYAETDPDAPWLAELLTCRWCASIWIGSGIVAARRLAPVPWGYVARGLAASSAAALLASIEED